MAYIFSTECKWYDIQIWGQYIQSIWMAPFILTNFQSRDWTMEAMLISTQSSCARNLRILRHQAFPYYAHLPLLLIILVSTAATEHSHSSPKTVNPKVQAQMGEDRLNALLLLYIQRHCTSLCKDYWYAGKQVSSDNEVFHSSEGKCLWLHHLTHVYYAL